MKAVVRPSTLDAETMTPATEEEQSTLELMAKAEAKEERARAKAQEKAGTTNGTSGIPAAAVVKEAEGYKLFLAKRSDNTTGYTGVFKLAALSTLRRPRYST